MSKVVLKNLEEVFDDLKGTLDIASEKIKVDLVYDFNVTGKTRLSRMFTDLFENKTLANSIINRISNLKLENNPSLSLNDFYSNIKR